MKNNENKKEFVKEITNIEEDFAQWYTDIVLKAELADYTAVKGFITIKPYGYAIWENIQKYADDKFKERGVKNLSMPVLIPESLLEKEKEVFKYVDVLVDGQYQDELHNPTLKWKGSSNQRVIDIKKTLKENKIVTIE